MSGRANWEEIDRERVGIKGGRNYGWNAMEGMHCFSPRKCPLSGDTLPNAEYSHADGNCAVIGGYVYRGPTQTALSRVVRVRRLVQRPDLDDPVSTARAVNQAETLRADTDLNITSFGESESGELYAVTSAGGVYQVLAN